MNIKCGPCDKIFTAKRNLNRHIKNLHLSFCLHFIFIKMTAMTATIQIMKKIIMRTKELAHFNSLPPKRLDGQCPNAFISNFVGASHFVMLHMNQIFTQPSVSQAESLISPHICSTLSVLLYFVLQESRVQDSGPLFCC